MHIRPIPSPPASETGPVIAQLFALQVIRRALAAPGLAEDHRWRSVGQAFRHAHARMLLEQNVGLVVGEDGAVVLTRHERRLLRATAAAQTPDPALVDNLIFSLAPGRQLRPVLADAVNQLAAGLERYAHRLPSRMQIASLDEFNLFARS